MGATSGSGGGKTTSDEAVEDQLNAEASCTGACKWVTTRLHKLLNSTPQWASSSEMRQERLSELATLTHQTELPSCSVVVVGNTGAGKSTLLNSMLEEVEVLPTNGMRACTVSLCVASTDR
jgi:polynucleotide 5'-kinase involved in rRNA processing